MRWFKRKKRVIEVKNEEFLRKEQYINLEKYTDEEIKWMDHLSDFYIGKKGKRTVAYVDVSKLTREKLEERRSWKDKNKDRYRGWLDSIKSPNYPSYMDPYDIRMQVRDLVMYIYNTLGEDYRNELEKKGIKKKNTSKNRIKNKYNDLIEEGKKNGTTVSE